ncbi:MAG: sodium:solute symporter family transporter, partial [Cyclobacteriaceae bacterium]
VAMGLILNVVTGLAVWQGVLISTVVVTFYTVIGGMWAISITDFIQSIIIVVGLIVLAVVMSDKAGGWDTVMASVPADRFRFFPEGTPWGIMTWLAAWSVLGLGSIPSQDVYQRAMSSGSARTAEYSCYIAAALYLTVALLPLFISLCAQHLYANQLTGDGQLVLPRMVLEHTNIVVQILFFGSLLSAIMSTTSSAILAPAAIFSENLVRPLRSKPFTDREMLLLTR